MKIERLLMIAMVMAMILAFGLVAACGDDDDDDDDDNDAGDDDSGDDDTTGGDPIEELMSTAYDSCLEFWNACEVENAEEICQAWVDAYGPALEAYADTIDIDCMMQVMGGFFECVGEDCDPAGAWTDCNVQVEEQIIECFE
ncbi:MAG: hypothetical protein P9L99_03140 [Candidatus Lernaella stagnicola]|nr:hypothetical protein [Candidatus Lernaella stagnicola]